MIHFTHVQTVSVKSSNLRTKSQKVGALVSTQRSDALTWFYNVLALLPSDYMCDSRIIQTHSFPPLSNRHITLCHHYNYNTRPATV